MSERLGGKVAVITGASRGIGRATARVFAGQGAAVVINYARSREAAQQLADEIRGTGGKALAIQADVGRRADVQAMVEETLAQFGAIDILINNAGAFRRGTIQSFTEVDLDEMIAVNLKGTVECASAVAAHMIARRSGRIINVASIAAFGTAMPETTLYAAIKAAVIALTKRLALELGPHGINVNAICPGFIQTEMSTAGGGAQEVEARLRSVASRTMLSRVGESDDIAWAALFLASDEARFITAQALTVDGGRIDFLSHSG